MTTAYHAHIDGFSGKFFSVAEIQNWIDGLKAKHSLTGATLKVWKGVYRPGHNGGTYEFNNVTSPAFVGKVS